jgi:hypothetical protein
MADTAFKKFVLCMEKYKHHSTALGEELSHEDIAVVLENFSDVGDIECENVFYELRQNNEM